MNGPSGIYLAKVREALPRLVSWQDREAFSKTYGCFDRTFWGWKFSDFSGSRFQEGVHALAWLHADSQSPFVGDRRIREWTLAGIRWWGRIQYPDGSFDEAYPYEHSLAATAFSCFYIGEGVRLLAPGLTEAERNDLIAPLRAAAEWLCANDEHHGVLSNHLAAAAAALEIVHQITAESRYRSRSRYFIQRILAHQSSEGWYEEYGGFDAGYQTHAIFYLARIWELTADRELLSSLDRSIAFLKFFFHPDRTLGGEYSSRNTEFYFPAGFEILAGVLPDAAAIAAFMHPAVLSQESVGLAAMDAYNFLPMLNNYIFAARVAPQRPTDGAADMPCLTRHRTHFPKAGILVDSSDAYFAVIGLSKGGTVKVFSRDGQVLGIDCGYWTRLPDGRVISSQSFMPGYDGTVANDRIEVRAPFVEVNQRILNPWLFVCFRLFTLTLGRFQGIALWVKDRLVQALVRQHREAPLRLTRRIILDPDRVVVEDVIEMEEGKAPAFMTRGAKFATFHMGSSRYYQPQELRAPSSCDETIAVNMAPGISARLTREIMAVETRASVQP